MAVEVLKGTEMIIQTRVIRQSPAGLVRIEEVSDTGLYIIGYRVIYRDAVLPMQMTCERADELFELLINGGYKNE